MLKTVSRSRVLTARESRQPAHAHTPWHLVCNTDRQRFRALLIPAAVVGDTLELDAVALERLAPGSGNCVRAAEFDAPSAGVLR